MKFKVTVINLSKVIIKAPFVIMDLKSPVYKVEITKTSGEIIDETTYKNELHAHDLFEKIEAVRWPDTYKGYIMNLSEEYTGGNIGSVRVVVEYHDGIRRIRREKWRNA